MNDAPRLILALAAEADDEFIWDRLTDIKAEMFAAGPVQIKFAYFGREEASQVRPVSPRDGSRTQTTCAR
jgi:hypothetical protein